MAHSSQAFAQSAASGSTATGARTSVVFAAFAAISLGLLLVAGVGFAAPEAIHNAAHDSRHSLAVPCH